MKENNLHTIENDTLKVTIKNAGAEPGSILNKNTGLEHLWQAGKEWPKQAPVLFPVVGQLKNNSYQYQNKNYTLERHGFARNQVFRLIENRLNQLVFRLEDNEESRLCFPFSFCLDIVYNLHQDQFTVEYIIRNKGNEVMYFSIGAHPAFKVPLTPDEKYDNYFLKFNKKEKAYKHHLKNGLINNQTSIVLDQSDILPLSKSLFYDDALVFKNLLSDSIQILNKKNRHGLSFNFKGFPYFGIWAARDADFVCLEPWHGIADSVLHNQNLESKEGILLLKPDEIFSCSWSVQSF